MASPGWVDKFMARHGLSLRRKTTVAQKDPEQLIDKLVGYVLHIRRFCMKYNYLPSSIIAMDELQFGTIWYLMLLWKNLERKRFP